MLQPKKTKFRKMQKGRMKGLSQRGHQLSNGMFGIKALDSTFITSRQIEAARIAATRYMKREGQLWIRVFPDKPITKKPLPFQRSTRRFICRSAGTTAIALHMPIKTHTGHYQTLETWIEDAPSLANTTSADLRQQVA